MAWTPLVPLVADMVIVGGEKGESQGAKGGRREAATMKLCKRDGDGRREADCAEGGGCDTELVRFPVSPEMGRRSTRTY